jgi:SulP family sulfate permease
MLVTTIVVCILPFDSVKLIGDIAQIPDGLPRPFLPELSLVPELIIPAITIGLVGLIQGAGVSRSVPNSDGEFPDASRDFSGQGLANSASGFFQGLPIGGTMSETSVNISSGAKTRLANVLSGLFIIILVLLFGSFLELVPLPAIAALLIVAGFESIKMGDIEDVRDTGPGPRLIMIITFAATLFLPIQEAVLAGVVLSLLHYIYRSSNDVHVLALKKRQDGALMREKAPEKLPSDKVTALSLYGSMFFASAYLLEETLPSPAGAKRAVAVLHLRGLETVGSTFIKIIERYAERLQEGDGTLFLAGVTEGVYEQLEKTETTQTIRPEHVYIESQVLGHSMLLAMEAADAWLAGRQLSIEENDLLENSPRANEGKDRHE